MSFIHAHALCETQDVGPRTRIWAFAHILPGAKIGEDCNICDHVFIEGDVLVGNRVTVKCGVQLWDGLRIGDDVFIGPNATFTNDRFPRSKAYPEHFAQTVLEDKVSIGANATILPGLRIGYGAMIGAGAVVLTDVAPRAIVVGNPGRVVGYADAKECRLEDLPAEFAVKSIKWSSHTNSSGRLLVTQGLPFPVRRIFTIDLVESGAARGAHAHKACHQLLKINSGAVTLVVDDGHRAFQCRMDDPSVMVYLPPLIWGTQFAYGADSSLMVFASEPYDPADYVHDYTKFLSICPGRS